MIAIADRDGVSIDEVARRGARDTEWRMAYIEWRNQRQQEANNHG